MKLFPQKFMKPILLVTVGTALGVGGTLSVNEMMRHGDTSHADSYRVTSAISTYVDALNSANTQTIGAMSCGIMKSDFDKSAPIDIANQLHQAITERGTARVGDFRNVSIEGDTATAAGLVSYQFAGKTQDNLTIYGLRQVDNQWKLCWSKWISSHER